MERNGDAARSRIQRNRSFWREQTEWKWQLSGPAIGLAVTMKDGKRFRGRLVDVRPNL